MSSFTYTSFFLFSTELKSNTQKLGQKKCNSKESNLAANEGFTEMGLLCSQLLQRERQVQCPYCPLNVLLT